MIDLRDIGSHVLLQVRTEIRGGANLPTDFDIASVCTQVSTITLVPQWWMFPETHVTGVPTKYVGEHPNRMDWWGTMALGLRCLECRKVFFAAGLEDFHHECSGYPSPLGPLDLTPTPSVT